MAPELCEQKAYDSKVDVWAVGVILYVMMSGRYPFVGKSKEQIYKLCVKSEPDYTKIQGSGDELLDVIKACLIKKAADRPTIAQVLEMPWFETMRSNKLTDQT